MESIREDDTTIRAATADAHFPSLAGAVAQLTGDPGILRGGRPAYDFFGDGQGGFSAARKAQICDAAVAAMASIRDKGVEAFAAVQSPHVHDIMNFVAGADISDRYVPFLREQLGVQNANEMFLASDVPDSRRRAFHVLIVGAGMSGILAAIHLGKAGIPFTIVDKNADVGGTWFENTYPGCRVDNPNHMYSYSFAPNHDWPHHYSTRDALLAYFRNVADRHGVRAQVRFKTEVVDCAYDECRHLWISRLRKADGGETVVESNAVISAVGQLNRPKLPDIKGIGSFKGSSFHSAQWDHSVNLKEKRVLVIGTGASAFQFVPALAPDVGEMYVFQRTPPWLAATPDYHDEVAPGQKWLLKHMPWYAQWYRFWLFWMLTDGLLPYVSVDPEWRGPPDAVSAANAQLRGLLTEYLRTQTGDDAELLRKVVPGYPFGGKRALRDNGVWLGAFKRTNVHLIGDPMAEITPEGVRTASGRVYGGDVLIYGTGFHASRFLAPMTIRGRARRDLHAEWNGDARAYLGITVPGYPNFFMMYGPNTNIVVNGSIIFFSECAIRYIVGCIELLLRNGDAALEPKETVHDAFNRKVDEGNRAMAWGVPEVTSWYKSESGRVSQNWPFALVDYWEATRAPDASDFEFWPEAARAAAE
ncbi:MAG TPA: NAD(P)/FAD-dependent oxidoreductase [Rhizomicrobium sp.]|nr:NAD(P)/FAD-dependent oxidoreductase [Rhizomicrobium sp.]